MRLNERTRRWLPWALLAVAVMATAAVYWPGVTGGWVFDDFPNIVDNAAIHITRGHATLGAWVSAALSSPASFLHRPLASITFALNWYAGGGDPWPFKVTNIVIHLINGVLLFCMLRALLRLLGSRTTAFSAAKHNSASARAAETGAQSGLPAMELSAMDGIPATSRQNPSGLPALLHVGAAEAATSGHPAHLLIDDNAATRLALLVSAAWMLLPINLMAVLYVVQRMESLCQVFVLAGLWAYLHGRWMMLTAHDTTRDRHGLLLATTGIVLGTVLGLTSKETAVLLPVFAFLAEWTVLRFRRASLLPVGGPEGPTATAAAEAATSGRPALLRFPRKRRENDCSCSDKRIWSLFTVTLFIPAVLGFLWLLMKALRSAAFASRDFTLAQRLMTEPRVLVDYLHWTIFPNPEVLSLYHDEIVTSTGLLTPWTTLGSMLVLAALIVIAVWLRKRRPLVALGIGWFFAAQLLTATIVPLELVYEQRMYFASIGVLLALGSLLLGLRWRINWPLLRGVIAAIALLWFATVTDLRAHEWSNPLRQAVIEARRHPESPRAVYEGGRQLLIAANYQPGAMLEQSRKFFEQAAAIPGASSLADQALIMLVDHEHHGDDAAYWQSMTRKLREQPIRQEDISALISLTNCYGNGLCAFDLANLQHAYTAALSHPFVNPRLNGAYAAFQRDLLHDDALAEKYLAQAVAGAPSEPAYRIDLAALYARHGQTGKALEQIDALRRMNYGGRLDKQIALLEQLAEQGKPAASP